MGKPTSVVHSTNATPQSRPEEHAAGHSGDTRTGAKQPGAQGAAKPGSAHNMLNHGIGEGTKQHQPRRVAPLGGSPAAPTVRNASKGRRAVEVQAPTPAQCDHSQLAAGPGCRPVGRVVRRGQVPDYRHRSWKQDAHPRDALMPPSWRATPALKSLHSLDGDAPLHLQQPGPEKKDSGTRLHARLMRGWGRTSAGTQAPLSWT